MTVRDMDLAKSYLSKMQIVAPIDGIVNVLPNFRSGGSFGQSPPAFKEGDRAWTGAAIAEIPDLSSMYIDLKLEEVDRGMGLFREKRYQEAENEIGRAAKVLQDYSALIDSAASQLEQSGR